MSNAEGYALPKPGIPRTLGILNLIFGVLVFLFSFCIVGFMLAWPAISNVAQKSIKEQRAKVQAGKDAQLKELDEREKTAKTDEAKQAIQQDREKIAAIAEPPEPDFGMMDFMMTNPTIKNFSLAFYGGITILSLILIICGIGLVRLTPWGRSMGLAWAVMAIVFLVGLMTYYQIVARPVFLVEREKMLEKMEEQVKTGKAAPGIAESVKMTRAMGDQTTFWMIFMVLIGSAYPAILLILLNTAGARAACLGQKKPEGLEG